MTNLREIEGGILVARDFVAAGVACGIKDEAKDLMLLHSLRPAAAAATITTNRFRAAPTYVTERHVADGCARTVVVNSGNANAATGTEGMASAERMAELGAEVTGVALSETLVCSTGSIGVQLPMERVEVGIRNAAEALSRDADEEAARAIMTTDTVPKRCAVEFEVAGETVRLGAMTKGAGMICPNMATMLCFICTDADVAPAVLSEALKHAVARSFNCISVEGDMSTNDTVIALANGAAGNARIEGPDSPGYDELQAALVHVTRDLAQKIARDGEGSGKFMTVRVTGAATYDDAHTVARAVTLYTLVKTSVWGGNFNWGRTAAAVGASGVEIDPASVTISLGGITSFRAGEPVDYDREEAAKVMAAEELEITVDLGAGAEEATCWTCDMTPQFVELNA